MAARPTGPVARAGEPASQPQRASLSEPAVANKEMRASRPARGHKAAAAAAASARLAWPNPNPNPNSSSNSNPNATREANQPIGAELCGTSSEFKLALVCELGRAGSAGSWRLLGGGAFAIVARPAVGWRRSAGGWRRSARAQLGAEQQTELSS